MKGKLNINKDTFKKVLKFIAHYRVFVIFSMIFAIASVVFQLYIPILSGKAIDYMLSPNHVDFKRILSILFKIVIIAILSAISQWTLNVCNNHITYCLSRDMRNQVIRKIQTLPLSYLDSHSSGDLLSRMISDVETFSDGIQMTLAQLFTGIVTIIGIICFMLSINSTITFVVVLLTPFSLFIAMFISKRTYQYFQSQSIIRGEQTAFINEMVEGQKVVQAFGYEDRSLGIFDSINSKLQKVSLKAIFFSSLTNPVTRFYNNMVYAAVGLAGALFAITGGITIGQLSIFLNYTNQYTKPFNEISGVITELQNALACAARVFELLDEESQTSEAINAIHLKSDGHVSIEDMSFSYEADNELIQDFNLNVKPGQRVAIVGPTGAGKTTLDRKSVV